MHQRGQTLPLIGLFMVSLLGVSGMVLDLGNGYAQQRAVQNEADAAAIAGAAQAWQWSGAASGREARRSERRQACGHGRQRGRRAGGRRREAL